MLLVEDDEGDVLMTREAFEFHKIRNPLHVVTDGEQALQFMRRTGPYADAPRPGLILLDVNLPRLSGLEVLAELKQDPELAVIPVVMLTTSQAEEDILRSYKLHANAYVTKPVDFEQLHRGDPADRRLLPDPGPAAQPRPGPALARARARARAKPAGGAGGAVRQLPAPALPRRGRGEMAAAELSPTVAPERRSSAYW